MALRRDVTYSGRFTPATTERPQGGFKNRTSPTSEDGSYLEEQWLNDLDGFFASALMDAGVVPNGNVDEGGNSQLYDAVLRTREVTPLNNSWNGFLTRDHITQLPSPAGVPATSGSGGTAYSADDEWSIGNFATGGTISLDDDGLVFSQGIYKLFTFTAEQLSFIDVTKVSVYIVGQDGSRHFVKHNGAGVIITKPNTTTLKVRLDNSVFAELGITKLFSFFVTAGVGYVPQKYISDQVFYELAMKSRRWEDVTSQRFEGVTYTNTTITDIDIAINATVSTAGNLYSVIVDGTPIYASSSGNSSYRNSCLATVPPGATYRIDSTTSIFRVNELRV